MRMRSDGGAKSLSKPQGHNPGLYISVYSDIIDSELHRLGAGLGDSCLPAVYASSPYNAVELSYLECSARRPAIGQTKFRLAPLVKTSTKLMLTNLQK